jgi:hypothetical protein
MEQLASRSGPLVVARLIELAVPERPFPILELPGLRSIRFEYPRVDRCHGQRLCLPEARVLRLCADALLAYLWRACFSHC